MDANGRSLAKAALLTVSADLSHTRTHTIPVIVFFIPEETQETVKYQPVSLKNAAIESFTKCCRADSNHQAEGCSFSLLFHRPHSRFSSTTVVSDIISEPAGKLFCYTCERVRTPSGSSHTPNLFKVAFTCPQLVRVLKAYNKSGLQS